MQNTKLFLWLFIIAAVAFFLNAVSTILAPFITSVIIAYLLNPLTIKLERLGLKRNWTVSIIVGLFVTVVIISLIKLIPSLFEQIQQFIAEIPNYKQYVTNKISVKLDLILAKIDPKIVTEIKQQLSHFSNKFFEYIMVIIHSLFESGLAFMNIIALFLFTPILVFYLLRDWPSFVKTSTELLPLDYKKLILEQLKQIDLVLSAYLRGQTNVCLILSLFYVTNLSILGLNYALLVGIITGFLTIIPYLGLILGGTICGLIALIQFDGMKHVYIVLAIFIVGNLLESYVVTPKLVGEKVGLHPVWLIFALMSGGTLFGFWGIFFAIPVAAILGVIIRSLIKFYLASELYAKVK